MGKRQEEVVSAPDGALPGIERANVERWLHDNVAGIHPPLDFALIAAGGSNLTYRVVDATGRRFILRRPPAGKLLPSAHDMTREHRIMAALGPSAVPVPEMLGVCDDEAVTGAPFYVMDYVEGLILRDAHAGAAIGEPAAKAVSEAFVDTLAAIHTLDPATVGLDTLSRPDGYVARQLKRWFTQYGHTAGDEPDPRVADLHDRLAANIPPEGADRKGRILHGDYHIDNVVFDEHHRAIAVLDWELCALGDPLADLAWALMFWATGPDELSMTESPATLAPGFLPRPDFLDRYRASSGLDLADLTYFLAFSHWKLACLIQGSIYRRRAGQGGGLQAKAGGDHDGGAARQQALLAEATSLAAEAGI